MTMIEKMARAMFEDDPAYKDSAGNQRHTWDDWPCNDLEPRRHWWLQKATVALAAMREPTDTMRAEMVQAYAASIVAVTKRPEDGVVNSRDTDAAWRAGIDAALAEAKTPDAP